MCNFGAGRTNEANEAFLGLNEALRGANEANRTS